MTNSTTDTNISTFEIAIVTFQVLIMFFIVTGNVLVLCAFKRFHHLQTSTGRFIANLAIADLCLGITLPFQISFFFYPELNFIIESCLLRFELIIFTSTSSLLSLFFTVVDRYIAVLYPLRYHVIMSEKVANILICIVWIYAATLAIIPLLGYNTFKSGMFCAYELVMATSYRLLVALHFIVLPVIMFLIYCRVFFVAWSHKKKIMSEQCFNTSIHVRIQKEMKMAVIMAVVMLGFSLCWLPFAVIQIIQALEFSVNRAFISNFLVFLGLLNSVINPFIYVWKNKQYKEAFRKIICLCQKFETGWDMNSVSLHNSAPNTQVVQVIPLRDITTALVDN
ncbi:adenosine receptor A2b-like [Mytilus trossulus]|uniref:adenosine receptor A2b-like n=1 Tax=Mytilus trossulus TaxID=6551 RepID=UPI0030045780